MENVWISAVKNRFFEVNLKGGTGYQRLRAILNAPKIAPNILPAIYF